MMCTQTRFNLHKHVVRVSLNAKRCRLARDTPNRRDGSQKISELRGKRTDLVEPNVNKLLAGGSCEWNVHPTFARETFWGRL